MSERILFDDLRHKATAAQLKRARADVGNALSLAELRRARELTQEQLARALELSQPGISRIEHQTDLYLSTLRSYVRALGGELDLIARFANVDVPIQKLERLDADVAERLTGRVLARIEINAGSGAGSRIGPSDAIGVALALDERDQREGETEQAGELAEQLAIEMGLTLTEQAEARLVGLVKNIGMIYVDSSLVFKPGALTLDERRQVQTHSEMGARLLESVFGAPVDLVAAVRHHHERVDGQGYPDGLTSDQIPLLSRIISVVEAFVAMTHARPYRDAMPARVARVRLAQAIDTQFDAAVVAALESVVAGEPMCSQEAGSLEPSPQRINEPDNVYSLLARLSA